MTVGVRIDESDPTPPYEQLRRQLSSLIQAGALVTGARLPPVRQLAADLSLATGTVARAYRELEQAGLVRTRRGAGTTVAPVQRVLSGHERHEQVGRLAAAVVQQARLLGATDAEIRDALERALPDVDPAAQTMY